MKEPKKIPLDPFTPKVKNVKTIPMPSLYPEGMADDVYSKEAATSFWKFMAKHKESRENWLKRKDEQQNNSEGDQT